MYVCMYVCMYVHTYIHTDRQTRIDAIHAHICTKRDRESARERKRIKTVLRCGVLRGVECTQTSVNPSQLTRRQVYIVPSELTPKNLSSRPRHLRVCDTACHVCVRYYVRTLHTSFHNFICATKIKSQRQMRMAVKLMAHRGTTTITPFFFMPMQ